MITYSPSIPVAEGISFRCLDEDRIRLYSLQTLDGRAIDAWLDHVIQGLADCPTHEVYRVIYDFSDISLFGLKAFWSYTIGSLGMTAAGKDRVRALLATDPAHNAKLAIFTHPTLSARVAKKVDRTETDVPFKIFFVMDQAIDWLKKEVVPHG